MIEVNDLLSVAGGCVCSYVLISAAILSFCFSGCSLFRDIEHLPEERTVTAARLPANDKGGQCTSSRPYRADYFPGARSLETVYGTIQVFEWGPEHGEKVLVVHGLCTPSISMSNMAKELVGNGYRVMVFDLFGRGYSDAPNDLAHDARLYTTQILLVLASSSLSWTGSSAFHLVGFSLGGSIAVAFAAYHSSMLRSLALVCPGGLIRKSHINHYSRIMYSSPFLPQWVRWRLLWRSMEPSRASHSATEVREQDVDADIDFDHAPIATDLPGIMVGDVIRWQLDANPGFINSYLSTIRSALVYRRHDGIWRRLARELARRRSMEAPAGLPGGRVCIVLAKRDTTVVADEFLEDMSDIFNMEHVEMHVVKQGHEIGISQGKQVASIIQESWNSHKRD